MANAASFAAQLPQGQPIEPGLIWNNASDQDLVMQSTPGCRPILGAPGAFVCVSGAQYTGSWSGSASVDSPTFLGLRFESAGTTYYGWARLSIPWGNPTTYGESFTLKDYAYNSVPGEGSGRGYGIDHHRHYKHRAPGHAASAQPVHFRVEHFTPHRNNGCRQLQGAVIARPSASHAHGRGHQRAFFHHPRSGSLAPGTYLLETQMDGERIVRKVVKE